MAALFALLLFAAAAACFAFAMERRMTTPEAPGICDTEYQEALSSYRHYSLLRFSIAGVFSGLTGGLLLAANADLKFGDPATMRSYVAALGLVVTVLFFYVEWLLNQYLNAFAAFLDKRTEPTHWKSRPKIPASPAIWALYAVVLVSWGFILARG